MRYGSPNVVWCRAIQQIFDVFCKCIRGLFGVAWGFCSDRIKLLSSWWGIESLSGWRCMGGDWGDGIF